MERRQMLNKRNAACFKFCRICNLRSNLVLRTQRHWKWRNSSAFFLRGAQLLAFWRYSGNFKRLIQFFFNFLFQKIMNAFEAKNDAETILRKLDSYLNIFLYLNKSINNSTEYRNWFHLFRLFFFFDWFFWPSTVKSKKGR